MITVVIFLWLELSVSIGHPSAGTDNQYPPVKQIYMNVLENGVDAFEPLYTEPENSESNYGFYDIRKYGNWTHPRNEAYHTLCVIPGNGQVILTYAVLLNYSQKERFGSGNYKREALFRHLEWYKSKNYIRDHLLPDTSPDLP